MRPILPALVVLLGLLGPIHAGPVHAGAVDWTVDAAASRLGFVGGSGQPPSGYAGSFRNWTAEIRFDPADPSAGRVRVVVDTNSIALGHRREEAEVRADEFFDVWRFPEAVFVAERFVRLDGNRYRADGTLTIRDRTHPVVLDFALSVDGPNARAQGEARVKRLDFGLGRNQWRDPAALADDVRITVDLAARRID